MAKVKISVVIPAYEMHGVGVKYIKELLESIKSQTYTNFEVIVADHSVNSEIELVSQNWPFDIKHFYNERGRGNASVNMNEGLKRASGDIIKIMHMDDLFCNNNAFKLISESISEKYKWGVVGFNHVIEPDPALVGETIGVDGCPSTSFFIRNVSEPDLFDENLVIINDKDMHTRLKIKYGEMAIISEMCVTIRMHEYNFAKEKSQADYKEEYNYFRNKGLK